MPGKEVKRARLQAWPLWLFIVIVFMAVVLITVAFPSPDSVPLPKIQRLVPMVLGAGFLLMAINQAFVQGYSRLVGRPLAPMTIETVSDVERRPQSFLRRILEAVLARILGPRGSLQRLRSYLIVGSVVAVVWTCTNWYAYYYPLDSDRGREMAKLDLTRITTLSPGDIRRIPPGRNLSFRSVKRIWPAVALVLGEKTAYQPLSLDGLKSIDNLSLKRLVSRPGSLSLDGLESLTDDQAEILARHHGGYLSLNGVTHLADASAMALARHKGRVHLRGLKQVSDEGQLALRIAEASLPKSLEYSSNREGSVSTGRAEK